MSLLGAALALQVQRFVEVEGFEQTEAPEALDPYYRAHACADGLIALACLNTAQREHVCELLGLHDPWAENPQEQPADDPELAQRRAHVQAVEDGLARMEVEPAVGRLCARGVPASEVRSLDELFDDAQANANGLVQTVRQPGVGSVACLLGSLFKVDGVPVSSERPAPSLDEHRFELGAS